MAMTALPIDAGANEILQGESSRARAPVQADPADARHCWWVLRNCSVTPRQLLAFYASISGVSLLIALAFAVQGATFILGFAGLELLALGAALFVYARHARDGEVIWIDGATMHVERRRGAQVHRHRLSAAHVRVELQRDADGRRALWLCSGRRRIAIGSQVRAHRLPALQQQILQALGEMQRPPSRARIPQ